MRELKICHISDLHEKHKKVQVPECDVLVCSGDISMMGYKYELESFFSWFKKQTQATYKILVGGNHDLTLDRTRGGNSGSLPIWLVELLADFTEYGESTNNFYLENESCEILGVKFWGSPMSTWFHGENWAFNVREPEAEALYSTIPEGTDVVITHGPAYTQGDWCINCACYVGDHTLLKHVRRVKPLLHLFGHIHESYGHYRSISDMQEIHHFNGCNCDLSYEIHNKPWLIDINFDTKEVEVLNERV